MREILRYICSTKLMTIPYSPCIDLTPYKINAVARVFRAQGYMSPNNTSKTGELLVDPMYLSAWQMMAGNGNIYNINNWALDYSAWNAGLLVRNTISTDLLFRFERDTNKLYINCAFDYPAAITIEYIPRFDDPDEIKSDYWIDLLMTLSKGLVKIVLGRIRTRYKQANPLWDLDGETLLNEGNEEVRKVREELKASTLLCYPVD